MVVVSIVIIVFLLHLRSAFVVILALPVGVLLSFIPMYFLGVTANIMSLGGIAIAIGAMVDGAIVIIENVHKKLEHWETDKAERKRLEDAGETAKLEALPLLPERETVLIEAAKSVGKPIFFALLVIAVSFLPVFVLEAQSGRLFRPLAFTKTLAMFFGALLAVTLTPALLGTFIRGHIIPEGKNPVNRFLIWLYKPVAHLVLRFKWIFLAAALVALAFTYIPFSRIGSEFMPPLNEGSLLYMPSSVPGISIETGKRALQQQDALIKSVPEVETVFGNVTETVIVMLSVPFALIGGYWLLYLLGYNMSVAVAVGFIALAGVANQTAIVMIVYLDEAYFQARREGRMKTMKDLETSVIYGAVQRARPVVMTATALIIGLLPIMFGHGTGSDVMKRIATPMVGGLITSTILTLLVIPAVYFIWKWYADLRPVSRWA